jgi:hypothetical protein
MEPGMEWFAAIRNAVTVLGYHLISQVRVLLILEVAMIDT